MVAGDPPDDLDPESCGPEGAVASRATIEVSKEVQTILDTGEIRLIKSTTTCTDTSQEELPIWFFGSPTASLIPTRPGSLVPYALEGVDSQNDTLSVQQMVSAVDQLKDGGSTGNTDTSIQTIPGIDCPESLDLRNMNQFSILKFTDIRDPTNKSLVMIQGPGESVQQQYQDRIKAADKGFLTEKGEENENNDGREEREQQLEISNEVPLENMAVFIQRGGPKLSGLPADHINCSKPPPLDINEEIQEVAGAITKQAVGIDRLNGQEVVQSDGRLEQGTIMDSAANCFGCFRSDSPHAESQGGCFRINTVDSPSRTGLLSNTSHEDRINSLYGTNEGAGTLLTNGDHVNDLDRSGGAIPKQRVTMSTTANTNVDQAPVVSHSHLVGNSTMDTSENKELDTLVHDSVNPDISINTESENTNYFQFNSPAIAVDSNVVEYDAPMDDDDDTFPNDGLLLQAERPDARPSLDSGIWDVIQGKEGVATSSNSSQESTPMLVPPTNASVMSMANNSNNPPVSSSVTSPTQGTPEKSMVTYKAYLIDEELNTAVLERAKVTSTTKFLETPEKHAAISQQEEQQQPRESNNDAPVRPHNLAAASKKLAPSNTSSIDDENAFEDAVDFQIEHQYTEEMAYENEGETGVLRFRQSRRSSLVNTPESGSNGTNTPLYERREDREAIFKVIHDIKKISVLQRTPEDNENLSLAVALPLPQQTEVEEEELQEQQVTMDNSTPPNKTVSNECVSSGNTTCIRNEQSLTNGTEYNAQTSSPDMSENLHSMRVSRQLESPPVGSGGSYTESDMFTCVESPEEMTDGMETCHESQAGESEMETCVESPIPESPIHESPLHESATTELETARESLTDTCCEAEGETSDGYVTAQGSTMPFDPRLYHEDLNKRDSWGDPVYRMLPLSGGNRRGKRRPPNQFHHRPPHHHHPRHPDTDKTPTNDKLEEESDVGNTTSEYSTLTNSSTIESIDSEIQRRLPNEKTTRPKKLHSGSKAHKVKKAGRKTKSRNGSASASDSRVETPKGGAGEKKVEELLEAEESMPTSSEARPDRDKFGPDGGGDRLTTAGEKDTQQQQQRAVTEENIDSCPSSEYTTAPHAASTTNGIANDEHTTAKYDETDNVIDTSRVKLRVKEAKASVDGSGDVKRDDQGQVLNVAAASLEDRKSLVLPLDASATTPGHPVVIPVSNIVVPPGANLVIAGPNVVMPPGSTQENLDSPTNYEREHNAHYYRTTKPRRPPVVIAPKPEIIPEETLLTKDKAKRKGGIMDKMKGMADSLSERIQGFTGQKSPKISKSPKFFRKNKGARKNEDNFSSTKSLESTTDSVKSAKSVHSTESELEAKRLQEEIERKYSIKTATSPPLSAPSSSNVQHVTQPQEPASAPVTTSVFSYDPTDLMSSSAVELPVVPRKGSPAAVHEVTPRQPRPASIQTGQTTSLSTARDFTGKPITVMIPPPSTSSTRGSQSRLVTIVGDYSPGDPTAPSPSSIAPVHASSSGTVPLMTVPPGYVLVSPSTTAEQSPAYVVQSTAAPTYMSQSSVPAPSGNIVQSSPGYMRQTSAPVGTVEYRGQSSPSYVGRSSPVPGYVEQSSPVPGFAGQSSPATSYIVQGSPGFVTHAFTQESLPPVHGQTPSSYTAQTSPRPAGAVDQPVPSFDKPVYLSHAPVTQQSHVQAQQPSPPTHTIRQSPRSIRKSSLPHAPTYGVQSPVGAQVPQQAVSYSSVAGYGSLPGDNAAAAHPRMAPVAVPDSSPPHYYQQQQQTPSSSTTSTRSVGQRRVSSASTTSMTSDPHSPGSPRLGHRVPFMGMQARGPIAKMQMRNAVQPGKIAQRGTVGAVPPPKPPRTPHLTGEMLLYIDIVKSNSDNPIRVMVLF